VLLPTLGSAGDVHPFIGLGLALVARGHRATILTNPWFQPLIESQGLGFLPVGSLEQVESAVADPDLWHARKGFSVVARRVIVPSIEPIYRLIEKHAAADTVVAASSISFGARVAQDKLGIPTATVHLQPIVIRSLIDQGMFGSFRLSAAQPMWFKRAFFRLADWAAIDRILARPLNEFRATLGLEPVHRTLERWIHSPQGVIGFFPDWFATPQSDWPPHVHLVGFPLWDGGRGWDGGGAGAALPAEAEAFLNESNAPLVFTAGSAASTQDKFFAQSIGAARRLDARALLVTNFPQQLPRELPRGVRAFGYLPFSAVLPRAALIVHHGGIGTLAQAIKSGIPQLIVPKSHDQFDNAWRIEQLGLGRSIPQGRYRAAAAAQALRALLDDRSTSQVAREYSRRIDSASALARACELIESLPAPGSPAHRA
jgi:rhamnosyltransferase subunit B